MRAGRFRFQVHILVKSKMVKAFCCSLVGWIENGCILVWLLSVLPKRWIGGEGLNNGPFVIKSPPCLTNHGWYRWMPPLNALWLSCPTVKLSNSDAMYLCFFYTWQNKRTSAKHTSLISSSAFMMQFATWAWRPSAATGIHYRGAEADFRHGSMRHRWKITF